MVRISISGDNTNGLRDVTRGLLSKSCSLSYCRPQPGGSNGVANRSGRIATMRQWSM